MYSKLGGEMDALPWDASTLGDKNYRLRAQPRDVKQFLMLHKNSPLLFMLLPLELIARLSLWQRQRVEKTQEKRPAVPNKIPTRDKIDPQDAGVPPDPASQQRRRRLASRRLRRRRATRSCPAPELEGTGRAAWTVWAALASAPLLPSLTRVLDSGLHPPPSAPFDTFSAGNELNE